MSARETAVSGAVLVVLAGVVAWLCFQQANFSPAVTVGATAIQAAQAAPVASASTAPLLSPLPAGLQAMSPAESFTPATLSDKIDGKAELYLPAGFVAMRCQRLAPKAASQAWFEAFIYDMGKPENAFSVYSSQKRMATQDAGIGDYGYTAGNQLCLVHGHYYLELVGAAADDSTLEAAAILARQFVATTTVAQHANVAKDEALFPVEGMLPGSVMLLSADVFGFDQLNNTYVARYREDGGTLTLYLSRRANPADAAKLATALRGFFVNDYGGRELAAPASPAGAAIIEAAGAFEGVFAVGPYVAGVHEAPSREAGEKAMARLSQRMAGAK